MEILSSNKPKGTYADFESGNYSDKQFVFELTSTNSIGNVMYSKETGRPIKYPLSVTIPMVGTIYTTDAKGKKYPRRIRYVPGETSIFIDEQSVEKIQKEPNAKKVYAYANFVNGKYRVDGNESVLLTFLFNWDLNETKKDRDVNKTVRFRLVDSSKKNEKTKKDIKLEFDVVNWCLYADWKTKIKPFASLIFTEQQMLQAADDIRHDLARMAKMNPMKFKSKLDDPRTERGIMLNTAIEKGIISISRESNSLFWTNNPSDTINVAGSGQNVVQDFITKSYTSRGEDQYNKIVEYLDELETHNSGKFSSAPEEEQFFSKEEVELLIQRGLDYGVITSSSKNMWWKYKDNAAIQTREKFVQFLLDNPKVVQELKEDVIPVID